MSTTFDATLDGRFRVCRRCEPGAPCDVGITSGSRESLERETTGAANLAKEVVAADKLDVGPGVE